MRRARQPLVHRDDLAHQCARVPFLGIAGKEDCIVHTNGVVTVQLGPNQVFAGLSTEFRDSLTTPEIEQYVERVETAIRAHHPEVVALYVKPQTHEVWEAKRRSLPSAE